EYAVWWPERSSQPAEPKRLWILVPGGMSDGDSVAGYFHELLQSGVIDKSSEDWCLFHNAGTGGAEWRKQTYAGLSDPAFLLDYLKRLGAYSHDGPTKQDCLYREIIVLGFSVGGMLTLSTADKIFNGAQPTQAHIQKATLLGREHLKRWASFYKDGRCIAKDGSQLNIDNQASSNCTLEVPCRLRFVSVHSPDHLRNTFEAMTKWSWFARLDIPLALHFWAVNLRNRLIFKCPEGRLLPFPPTWSYIRHITEVAWAQNQVLKKQAVGESACQVKVPFEHLDGDFSLQVQAPLPPGEVLRIQNPEDPVVNKSTLDPHCLQKCDVWWFREGGHVMCFGASPKLARRLRKWVEHPPLVS
ncbi:rluD, partial [Symbiodinium natans]